MELGIIRIVNAPYHVHVHPGNSPMLEVKRLLLCELKKVWNHLQHNMVYLIGDIY